MPDAIPSPDFLDTAQGRRIAFRRQAGAGPGIVFVHGFRSDMTGSKAEHLAAWARSTGRAFLRFDVSGHGASAGNFADGAIGDWAEDTVAAISALTEGPQVLVGSSMGGWLALLAARALPDRIAGLVGIAAAPDFTEDSMWAQATEADRARLMTAGQIELPTDYDDAPYVITRRLIEDGRQHLVLRTPLHLPFAVRLLHGTADRDVPLSVPLRLIDHATCADMRLTLVKDADHRFSTPECLALIEAAVADVGR